MNMWQKARARGVTLPNVISYVCIRGQSIFSGFWGTLALRCKAALLGVRLGRGVRCFGSVILSRWPGSTISIGEGASLVSCSRRVTAATLYAPTRLRTLGPGAAIDLADGVQLNGTSITARSTRISVGAHSMFAPNCVVVDSDFHAHWPPETRHCDPGYEHDAAVSIGAHVWVGMNCIILKGVSIGEGAVIGAGSVVTRSVPPRCLAAGTPARVLRTLDATPSSAR